MLCYKLIIKNKYINNLINNLIKYIMQDNSTHQNIKATRL